MASMETDRTPIARLARTRVKLAQKIPRVAQAVKCHHPASLSPSSSMTSNAKVLVRLAGLPTCPPDRMSASNAAATVRRVSTPRNSVKLARLAST